jgi:hypothetical protein
MAAISPTTLFVKLRRELALERTSSNMGVLLWSEVSNCHRARRRLVKFFGAVKAYQLFH